MTPETLDLFRAVVDADVPSAQRALAAGADVNATDGKGRNVVSHAALGSAIEAIDTPLQPFLSENRLEILQLVLEHPDLSLYSLNAPLPWAGGVTLLGLMSWFNMPAEIMFLLEYTEGLVGVNAMDEQGATPLMYASRDGRLDVVQRLLAHGARPDLRDSSQRSAIQYALPYPQILWLCEDSLRRERAGDKQPSSHADSASDSEAHSTSSLSSTQQKDLFLATTIFTTLKPPSPDLFDSAGMRRVFDALLSATRSGDDSTLHSLLFSPQLESSRTLFLVNLRDSSGLSLVHHAISQRHNQVGVVLDVLYRAGADVGLFSTLGFSPLHHLARTARDPPYLATAGRDDPPVHVHDLYKLTLHLLRDLHAPLGASDAKGETSLHAAAEHGNSRLVLKAMLDYDSTFSAAESVREMRNDRRLRPVEVCQPEFLSLFAQKPVQVNVQLRTQDSWDSIPRQLLHVNFRPGLSNPGLPQRMGRLLNSSRPRSGPGVLAKTSDGSLQSHSSESSTSSSAQPYRSRFPRLSPRSRKPGTPLYTPTLPTPSPTGTSWSDLSDTDPSFNVSECTQDLLSNISLISSTLDAFKQTQIQQSPYETVYGEFPDLPALSDTIMFARDAGSLILEHWTARLDQARAGFERARRELEKTQVLREKVGMEVAIRLGGGVDDKDGTSARRQTGVNQNADTAPISVRDNFSQTDDSAVYIAHLEGVAGLEQERASCSKQLSTFVRLEEEQLKEPATFERATTVLRLMRERRAEEIRLLDVENRIRIVQWYAASWGEGADIGTPLLMGWVMSGQLPPLEIVKAIEDNNLCAVGREAQTSIMTRPTNEKLAQRRATISFENTSRSSSRVLQRAELDLRGVISHLAQITELFIRAQQSVNEASTLFEQALKECEDRLHALTYVHPQPDSPHPPSSFRLPRVPQRSSYQLSGIQVAPIPSSVTISPSPSSSNLDHQFTASAPGKEPDALRRLLTRKIEKNVEHLFHELQKAHVWLRIIREVLRGLRRRAVSVGYLHLS